MVYGFRTFLLEPSAGEEDEFEDMMMSRGGAVEEMRIGEEFEITVASSRRSVGLCGSYCDHSICHPTCAIPTPPNPDLFAFANFSGPTCPASNYLFTVPIL